jgi:glycerol uptake facilitator-like aquaporin
MNRHCQNLSETQPTGANLNMRRRQGEASRARRREQQREAINHVVTAVMIWIVAPIVGAALAIGLVRFGIWWLRSH